MRDNEATRDRAQVKSLQTKRLTTTAIQQGRDNYQGASDNSHNTNEDNGATNSRAQALDSKALTPGTTRQGAHKEATYNRYRQQEALRAPAAKRAKGATSNKSPCH